MNAARPTSRCAAPVERRDESLRLAKEAIDRAFLIEDGFPEANALLGRVYMLEGDYDAAIATTGRALAAPQRDTIDNAAAGVAELADAQDLGSCTERCGGSNPPSRS